MKSYFKSLFCTHFYGHYGGGAKPLTPAFFMRPRRRLVEKSHILRVAKNDPSAVACVGCGHRFFETSKINGFEFVQEIFPPQHYNPYDPLQMQPSLIFAPKSNVGDK